MKSVNLVVWTLFFLSLIHIHECRPFNENEKNMLKKQAPTWKAPKIDEFLENNVSKKGPIYTYKFTYKNDEENKVCAVTVKEKRRPDGTAESQHKWKCTTELPEDPDYQGEDYERRRRKRHRRKKAVW